MWLLDANMDVHLASVLTGFDISCDTAGNRGWKAMSNGDLVKAADAGFRCLLTRGHLFGNTRLNVCRSQGSRASAPEAPRRPAKGFSVNLLPARSSHSRSSLSSW
jgi:hypothetical protein